MVNMVKLFEHTVTKLKNIIDFCVLFLVEQLINIENPYWKDTIIAWNELCLINVPTYPFDYLTSPLWYNPLICKQPILLNHGMTSRDKNSRRHIR